MQPTFRPHRKKRARKIGFRARKATKGGRKVLAARRRKGRKRLTVVGFRQRPPRPGQRPRPPCVSAPSSICGASATFKRSASLAVGATAVGSRFGTG